MMFRPTSPLAMVVKRNGIKPDDVEKVWLFMTNPYRFDMGYLIA